MGRVIDTLDGPKTVSNGEDMINLVASMAAWQRDMMGDLARMGQDIDISKQRLDNQAGFLQQTSGGMGGNSAALAAVPLLLQRTTTTPAASTPAASTTASAHVDALKPPSVVSGSVNASVTVVIESGATDAAHYLSITVNGNVAAGVSICQVQFGTPYTYPPVPVFNEIGAAITTVGPHLRTKPTQSLYELTSDGLVNGSTVRIAVGVTGA